MQNIKVEELFKKIMTDKLELDTKEYKELLKSVSKNYSANNKKENYKEPTLSEKRKRIQQNFYGTVINMLFQVVNTQANIIEQFNNMSLVVEAIADKVGVEFEKIETEEEKTMRAARDYLMAGAELRKKELAGNENIIPFKK